MTTGSDGDSATAGRVAVPVRLPDSQSCPGQWLQWGLTPAFEWNCYPLPVAQLPEALHGLRIVHLSDLHLKARWSAGYDRLIKKLAENPPDFIFITGDIVDDKLDHRKAIPTVERFFPQIAARHGVYAIAGNHDGDLLSPRLRGLGIRIIERSFVRLEINGHPIELIGLPGVKRRDFDPDFIAALPARTVGVPRIILGHYPDQIRFVKSTQAHAMLVGHTHGGQICLPNGYALRTHDKLPHHMARGVHRFGETLLFVNRGLGTTRWPIRIFCPAEVIELRLKMKV